MTRIGDSPFDPPGFGNMGGKRRRPREATDTDLARREMYESPPSDAVIDAIRPSGREGQLWRVSVSSESLDIARLSVARLPRDAVDGLRLAVETPWNPAMASAVLEAAHRSEARRYALNALSLRSMSSGRLRSKITSRGAPRDIARDVVEDLERAGLVDDRAMAEQIGRSALALNPVGARVLEARLRRRDIDARVAREVAEALTADRDPSADAERVARKKLRTLRPSLERAVRERRLIASLARRGFAPGTCRDVTRRLLDETDATPSESV